MNLFSYVLLLLYLKIILSSKSKREKLLRIIVLSAICSMFIEAGFFIELGDKEIDYGDFGLIVSFVYSIYVISTSKIRMKDFKLISLAGLAATIGVIGLVLWPYGEMIVTGDSVSYDRVAFGMTTLNFATLSTGNIIKLIYLLMYYTICLALYRLVSDKDKKTIIDILYNAIKIFLTLGMVEWGCAYIFHNEVFRNAVNLILGSGHQFLGLISRNDSYMLQGLCREASHYLFGLFISSIILFVQYKKYENRKALIWLVILGFIAVFATSLSSVLYLLFFIILVILYNANKNRTPRKRVITLIVYVTALFIIGVATGILFVTWTGSGNSYTLERIQNLPKTIALLFSDVGFSYIGRNYSSELIRLYSLICTFKNFLHRPLFGFGMGTTICHGSTMQFLTDVGLLGMALWYRIHLGFGTKKNTFFRLGLIIYILANVFSSMYLVPYVGVSGFVVAVVMDELFRRNVKEGIVSNEKEIKYNNTSL